MAMTFQPLRSTAIASAGYDTDTQEMEIEFANGRAAVNLLEANHYDLVFMDCHMPVMDGFEATAQVRKRELRTRERIPIVAMTANARSSDRDECLAAGMDDYLSKPVVLAELLRVIDRWVQRALRRKQGAPLAPPAQLDAGAES